MDTKTLCLGALTFGEATGYELRKFMQDCFGNFLEVSYAAIYPALADLHRRGLVDCEEVRQQVRPDKKVYRLTPAGREALTAALAKSPGRHRVRSEFLALMFFADHLPSDHLQKVMDERLEEFDFYVEKAETLLREQPDLPPGIRFAAGYAATVCRSAGAYIRANRDLLNDSRQPAAAGKGK
ncbi:MAG: PadR family transcriptional regulator [Aquisalimonadaceae bacterium]